MKSSIGRFILFSVLLLGLVTVCFAQADYRQWDEHNGMIVRQGYHIEWFRSMASNSDGELCVAWSDTRKGGRDIYLQKIGIDGEVLWDQTFPWLDEGITAADTFSRQEDPHVLALDDGSWIITWIDFRWDLFIEDIGDVYMQKVDSDGNIMWNTENGYAGVPVCVDTSNNNSPNINGVQIAVQSFPDGEGGAVAVWVDGRHGSSDIYAQRIDANGNRVWDDPGIVVAGGFEDQAQLGGGGYTADTDGAGGIIVGWVDLRDATDKNLFAQRVDVDGNLLWSPDGIPEEAIADTGLVICGFAAEQTGIKLCPDGEGGAFFAWQDKRTWFEEDSLYGDPLGNLYTQRVDADGNLMWTEDGEILCYAQATQFKHRIVNTAPGEAIVIWEDQRTDWFTSDLYMQKISGTNELELNWGEAGEETLGIILCDEPGNQFEARLTAIGGGDGGMVVSWTDERENEVPREDLYADRIDEDGNHLWSDGSGIIVSDAQLQQTGNIVRILDDGNDTNAAIVWFDYRDGSPGIYYQVHELEDGAELVQENGVQIIYGIDFNAENPQVIYNGTDFYVGWEDKRRGNNGKYAYIQKFDLTTGLNVEPDFPINGVTLTPGYPSITPEDTLKVTVDSVAYVINEQDQVLAAWQDDRFSYHTVIAAQKMTNTGDMLWGDYGAVVAPSEEGDALRNQERPKILPDGEGGAFVVFLKTNEDWWVNIHIQRLDTNGETMWQGDDNYGLRITDEEADHIIEDFEMFPNGNVLVIYYTSIAGNNYDLFAQCIDPDGNFVWGDPVPLSQADGFQYHADAELVDAGMLVVWEDNRHGSTNFDIFGQIIDEDGNLHWDQEVDGMSLIEADESQSKITMGVSGPSATKFWVGWQDTREPGNPDIYAQRFEIFEDSISHLLPLNNPNETGIPVWNSLEDQNNPKIVVSPLEDAYFAWEDAEGDFTVDLLYTHLQENGIPFDGFSIEGIPVNGLTPNADTLCNAYHQQLAISMKPYMEGEAGFLAAWEDLRSTGKEHLYNIFTQKVINTDRLDVNERVVGVPSKWSLESAYPNPFNPSTKISFTVGEASMVRLVVYDVLGRRVNELVRNRLNAGEHEVFWDGTDFGGNLVASGMYFYRLEADGVKIAKNVLLLK